MTNKRKIINDPVYDGFLSVEDEVLYDVIEHRFFQRQRHIKQLGLSYLVYPGAMHTRFSHMLGALNLMQRALKVLRMKGVEITDDECLGAQLAILLHDIGHGPFSHTSERVLVNVEHETITELMMQRINDETGGRLTTAIAIFRNRYHKRFLHQLVSSQLDMDRLDYLSRDSFFTGVSEGIVGTDRIINMLNVKDDELVIDEKGIYSIEKFIVSRRLMYWQVYMHKTVIAADNIMLGALSRAREVGAVQECGALRPFLTRCYGLDDFVKDPSLLELFAQVDDADVEVALKSWMRHDDKVLSRLASDVVGRHLPAIGVSEQPFSSHEVERLRRQVQELYAVAPHEAEFFVNTGVLRNNAYDFNDQEIKVLYKDGSCRDISEASDQLDRHFLEKQVTKYFIFYPKELRNKM